VYVNRLTLYSGTIIPHYVTEYGSPEIGTVLTFYTKPFLLSEFFERPCSWNPTLEFYKLVTTSRDDLEKSGFIQAYEVEVRVVCDNCETLSRIYLLIVTEPDNLSMYAYPSIDSLRRSLEENLKDTKPIYTYRRPSEKDPPPVSIMEVY